MAVACRQKCRAPCFAASPMAACKISTDAAGHAASALRNDRCSASQRTMPTQVGDNIDGQCGSALHKRWWRRHLRKREPGNPALNGQARRLSDNSQGLLCYHNSRKRGLAHICRRVLLSRVAALCEQPLKINGTSSKAADESKP